MQGSQRKTDLDLLRVLAAFAVVLIHVSGLHYSDFSPRSIGWQTLNFYDVISRWCVPMFVMISGALFLNPEYKMNLRKLYGKTILRIVAAYLVWAVVYAAVYAPSVGNFISRLYLGHFHMWYLFVIVGLYMLTPIYRKVAESEEVTKYFLLLGFVLQILPTDVLSIPVFSSLRQTHQALLSYMPISYGVYYVAGWYLYNTEFTLRQRKWFYVLGICGLVYTLVGTAIPSFIREKAMTDPFFNNFSVGVAFQSAALMVGVRYAMRKAKLCDKISVFIARLSKYSFGTYLVHLLVMDWVMNHILKVTSFPAILSVPVIALITFTLSTLISFVISKIPFFNRFAV